MAKKKRLNKAERQKRENMKWIYMFVALVITLTVYFAAFVEADKTQANIDFNKIPSLSREILEKLNKYKQISKRKRISVGSRNS